MCPRGNRGPSSECRPELWCHLQGVCVDLSVGSLCSLEGTVSLLDSPGPMCICACLCVCVYLYMYMCVCVYVHACVCLYMYACMCMHVSIRVCTCACVYECACVYVRVCMPALRLLLLSRSFWSHLRVVQHGAGPPAQHSCSTHLCGSYCLRVLISDPDPPLSLTLSLVSTLSSFEAQQGWGRSPGYEGPDHPYTSSTCPQPQPQDGTRERPNQSRNGPTLEALWLERLSLQLSP